jgi:hypothetical protein
LGTRSSELLRRRKECLSNNCGEGRNVFGIWNNCGEGRNVFRIIVVKEGMSRGLMERSELEVE